MVNISVGQRATVGHAGGEMEFVGGAELIYWYDSKSKSEDYHDDMNRRKHNILWTVCLPVALLHQLDPELSARV
jgi:hypothetical protein